MAFEVRDFMDLLRLLTEHPEWRSELRRLLLTEELLALPETVRELVRIQKRTEERVEALAEAQRRTEERVEALEKQMERLTSSVHVLTKQVESLTEAQKRTADTVSGIKGRLLEIMYREKASGYFGPVLRRLRVVTPHTLEDTLEARLSREEFKDVLLLDLLVHGQLRDAAEEQEVWLAVEVSSVVDEGDVERARRRATLLR
ncbi:MAG: hypothetical protein D6723_07010, partial [Acidobacteria bacterium]